MCKQDMRIKGAVKQLTAPLHIKASLGKLFIEKFLAKSNNMRYDKVNLVGVLVFPFLDWREPNDTFVVHSKF